MQNQGIGSWIDRKKARCSDDVAIIYRDERLHYGELAGRIARLAHALRDRGLEAGDRIAYLGNNHPSFIEALFAAATLGAIFVPLNSRLASPEIEFALEDSGAKILIFHHDFLDLARASSWSSPAQTRIVVRGEEANGVEDFDRIIAEASTEPIDVPVEVDDAAIILYTSGTTGHPKGAVISHGNIIWNSFNVLIDYGVSPGERVLLISPLYHVAALTNGALAVLLQGGTVVLHEKFDAEQVLKTIESERITMLSGVPTTYQMIHEHPNWETTDISSLQRLTCGGSAVPERTMEAYGARGLGFAVGYGMTETSPSATALPVHRTKEKVGSSGIRLFFTDVKIVDKQGNDVAPGVVGEILVKGPNVIKEYWRRPDATRDAFTDGWFRSGDLGHLDDEGYIYISDRLKDMIISGGENIYSAEVEAIIMELTDIAAVALIGVPDQKWGEVPHAYVQLKPDSALTTDDIVAHVATRLARYKIPKRIVFVDDFPRTASGKIRKNELRTRALAQSD
ncbi:AMP-dependent synthetase [Microbacterium sp. CH12i]|uniref:o-succinylbenzoate--CoA ligase n=1 Tax=Microbacterium sp. CH12i TaxID=1479651 RepID=UPI000460D9EE|nr:o-succinylbenzoate--CoA ligase [Microbacterium sp. CH12i]KDA04807.1 AMP-dependent synthetase [Microbacterium sp. CH12i]